MKAVVCTVALGGWYPAGAARLIQTMREYSPGIEVEAHVNTLPFGAPANVTEDGWDYTAYCAKPFALAAARNAGADIAILVDAAFYAVRSIHPLIDHIAQNGYYLCDNGNKVGEWCSDRAMERMNENREDLMRMTECSSYCVGLNFADGRSTELLHRWMGYASDRLTFAGPHTAAHYCERCYATGRTSPFSDGEVCPECKGERLVGGHDGRNRGFVSADPRVRGHRHDQTALSVLAYRMGMTKFSQRPRFTAYADSATEETVLANRGGL